MISDKARLGRGTVCGEYCVIEADVRIGKGCVIGHHAVIRAGSRIGDNVRIDDFACIGKQPMHAQNSAMTKTGGTCEGSKIGSGCIVGTQAVVYAGCTLSDAVLVADMATVREDVTVGEKTIIGRGVAVENHCRIGCRCKIETNAYLAAYSNIGDGCFIAPGVITSNDNFAGRSKERLGKFKGVTVESGGRIGAGAVILPGREIGPDGFAAAGSVVTRDVPEKTIVAGNPARTLRPVPENQLAKNQ